MEYVLLFIILYLLGALMAALLYILQDSFAAYVKRHKCNNTVLVCSWGGICWVQLGIIYDYAASMNKKYALYVKRGDDAIKYAIHTRQSKDYFLLKTDTCIYFIQSEPFPNPELVGYYPVISNYDKKTFMRYLKDFFDNPNKTHATSNSVAAHFF